MSTPRISFLLLALIVASLKTDSASAEVKSEFQHNMENFALSRDGLYRKNPDEDFTHGFFAAWPVILLLLGGKLSIFLFNQVLKHSETRLKIV